MLGTLLTTVVIWTAVALVAGILIGRRLRRRAAAEDAGRAGFRNSA